MLESVSVANIASYGSVPERLHGLSKFNYFFGANGSGKTTIGRIIADDANFPSCRLSWERGTRLEALAYNRDFVERNFGQATDLKGVFTLGEENIALLSRITELKAECDRHTKEIETFTATLQGPDGLGGKKGELKQAEERFERKCWDQKIKHDAVFQNAFKGVRGSMTAFKTKVLQEAMTNAAQLIPVLELQKKAESIFAGDPLAETLISKLVTTKLLGYEADPILTKRIIGKEDVDIAAMIKSLGNSDWVRQGRIYFAQNQAVCPFCQQPAPVSLAESLAHYFDETFERDNKAINDLTTDYATESLRISTEIGALLTKPSRFLVGEKLKTEKVVFDRIITGNGQRLNSKKREPSQVAELESVANVVTEMGRLIDEANVQIKNHNEMVENIGRERSTLSAQVWKFLVESELKGDLDTHKKECDGISKAITGLSEKIKAINAELVAKKKEIRQLEKQTTSTQPTVDGINAILRSFGFTGFSLAAADEGATYRLIRANGADAKATLSEGERTFVTFLYLYHLLKGSQSDSGMTANRLVIFDDPVSSLDSDVLFIVSSLIKGVLEDVRNNRGGVKQVFVLTHNVYFHREITFNTQRRNDSAMGEETFWIVRKEGELSRIVKHENNPIKTSYELLWGEVRNPVGNSLTIQNTLRRILENYFKILGGVDPDQICAMFAGKERLICKSLFSWVNAGSHFAHDDLYVPVDGPAIDIYLNVFRAIFEKTNHEAHYRMMMRDAFVERNVRTPNISTPVASVNIERETPEVGI